MMKLSDYIVERIAEMARDLFVSTGNGCRISTRSAAQ